MIRATRTQRNNMTIKAVTFDLDDTLWPLYDVIMQSHKLSNDWLINKYPQMEGILFTEQEREMWQRLVKAEPPLGNRLSELRVKVITTLLVENGVPEEDAVINSSKAFDIFLEERHKVTYFDGVLEILEDLGKEYSLGVLTNGNASIETLGIDHLFDFYLNAEIVNDSKPGAKMFEQAMVETSLKPNEICHVGDHPINDVEGALNVGFKAIWLNALENSWPEGQECHVPEVKNWYELKDVIKSL